MDRSDIEEMAKDLIPLAERTNAGEAVMTTDYDDKWEFFMGFRKKKKYRTYWSGERRGLNTKGTINSFQLAQALSDALHNDKLHSMS